MPRFPLPPGVACAFAFCLGASSASADSVPLFADRTDDVVEDADETLAVMFEPLAMAYGAFGGEADFVLQRSLALGVDAAASRPVGVTVGALGVGLLAYPLQTVFHGLYLEPRLVYGHALGQSSTSGIGEVSAVGISGWQWTWDYGLSIRLGAGVAVSSGGASPQAPRVQVGALAIVADAGLGWAW
jgi:hypothetical protein